MDTPLPIDPTYCPSCHKEIPPDADFCPKCGAPASVQARRTKQEEEQHKAEGLAQEQRKVAQQQQQEGHEAYKKTNYEKATGQGICPNCKSPNVLSYTFTEGASAGGKAAAVGVGCFFSPLAFLALPFLAGKKVSAYQCQYCSHRWRA